jgi:hypothetical protein
MMVKNVRQELLNMWTGLGQKLSIASIPPAAEFARARQIWLNAATLGSRTTETSL